MNAIDRAKKLIEECERALRDLLSQAALEGDYASLEKIANWAKILATFTGTHSPPNVVQSKQLPLKVSPSQKPKSSMVKSQYPFFKRSNNNLYKVGWSKKRKSEYKHNVTYDALFDIVGHFVNKMHTGNVYSTENLLPVADRNGQDIPSYQVYICIAWLKEIGILLQNGRQGYSMPNPNTVLTTVENAWIALQNSSIAKRDVL